jgi:hypothetical protein
MKFVAMIRRSMSRSMSKTDGSIVSYSFRGQHEFIDFCFSMKIWALGRCRPEAPTDPYVFALEHTVLQIMGSLLSGTQRG